jgi:ABC-2 type transport system permease protein
MRADVALRTLRDLRRGFAWWALGLVGLVTLQISVYPTVRDESGVSDLLEDYPDVIKDLVGFGEGLDYSSAPGYLGIELFSLVVPLLLIIAAVATGAAAIAGEEDRGTLDLLLSMPVSRRRVAAEKLLAMVVEIAGLSIVLLAALWVGVRLVDMEISAGHLAAAVSAAALLAIGYGAIALLIGAATGRRGVAVGLTAALALAAYLVNSLAALVPQFEGVQKLTPFYHYESPDPLRNGLSAGHVAVLVAIAALAVALTMIAVERRDLGA